MMKRIVLAGLAAAIVGFMWGVVSWMFLPWHYVNIKPMKDQDAVAEVLNQNVHDHSVYFLPSIVKDMDSPAGKDSSERYRKGPVAFMVVDPDGRDPASPWFMINGFLIYLVGGLLTATLLWLARASLPGYWHRVLFVLLVGLHGTLLHLVYWNYWSFPSSYTSTNVVDNLVGACFAGLVMAAIIKPQPAAD